VTITKSARQILRYGEAQIPYSIVVNPKRKQRVRINVHADGRVEIETPERTPREDIAKAVQKRAKWIFTHVTGVQKRFEQVLPREYVSGEQIFYLGRRYSLKVRQGSKRDRSVKLKGALLEVITDDRSREAVRTLVKAWYREKAEQYFSDRARAVAKRMPWKVAPPPIRLRDMKKRWGSCAVSGAITLNPALVRAPRECIDYVIAHELCHLREHNHSRAFFRLLNRAVPDWERTKTRLDEMAELLMNA
jgi:predicted metal-dependent hydrolase